MLDIGLFWTYLTQACRQCNEGSTCTQTGTNGAGVANTDFVFYVSANGNSPCGTGSAGSGTTIIAFATYCQTESSLDRYLLSMCVCMCALCM